jgi:cyclopropane-fatty-acyl-phospholipid synthase
MDSAKATITQWFAAADVKVNGDRPWDIRVHNDAFFRAIVRGGTLAFGESYMAGWWDAGALDELIARLLRGRVNDNAKLSFGNLVLFLGSTLSNAGAQSKAFEVGRRHYDIGNDLFVRMLDKRLTYTCGYWHGADGRTAKDLDAAQEAKLALVCRKLDLQKGQHILDIGCGWGSFAKFAAEKYGVSVTGVTVSEEQVKLGRELCNGLPVEFLLKDYRDIEGQFDHIVSLGMFEHVGYKNYPAYMRVAYDHLKDGGLFLLHSIGSNASERHTDPWINKYIFPNGMLPSIAQIGRSIENLFVMEDWHNFGPDYDKTLMAWFANFERSWPEIAPQYSETFYRMWQFYLLSCAAAFRTRNIQLWQIVLSKQGTRERYRSVR